MTRRAPLFVQTPFITLAAALAALGFTSADGFAQSPNPELLQPEERSRRQATPSVGETLDDAREGVRTPGAGIGEATTPTRTNRRPPGSDDLGPIDPSGPALDRPQLDRPNVAPETRKRVIADPPTMDRPQMEYPRNQIDTNIPINRHLDLDRPSPDPPTMDRPKMRHADGVPGRPPATIDKIDRDKTPSPPDFTRSDPGR